MYVLLLFSFYRKLDYSVKKHAQGRKTESQKKSRLELMPYSLSIIEWKYI